MKRYVEIPRMSRYIIDEFNRIPVARWYIFKHVLANEAKELQTVPKSYVTD